MKRLQQKCFIVSTGFHLLLAVIFLTSSGFLTSSSNKENPPDTFTVIDWKPVITTDENVMGGGEKNVKSASPAAALPPPVPVVKAFEKVADPEPVKEPAKEALKEPIKEPVKAPDPDEVSDEGMKPTKKHKIDLSGVKLTMRKLDARLEARARAEAQERADARRRAEGQQRLARALGDAATTFEGNGLSGGTDVRLSGPGGGGKPYANFLQAVKSIYTHAWIVPDAAEDDATTVASVTIARDGKVVSARILRSSGDRTVDRSVQAALDRVQVAAPLPASAEEEQRTVTINFNVKAKRAIG